ncbi:GHKL domain-containing protein [Bacillus sp. DNRA2]|uniref:ATP-binding protein n=1 Tax=Bacillus sp. DNRA2 TaxID=2723053 RepID=UPI00145E6915|nr:ATP-binding protein [Bacillus sp. DNRA2]NMD70469.1 GHKL domain-containing protein [Bacillus sp. DNRA2]
MQMDQKSVFEQLPFPYFIIDAHYQILFSSHSAKRRFSERSTIFEIVPETYWPLLDDYFNNKLEHPYVEVKMNVNENKMLFFQVYKVQQEDGICHLFCIPMDSYYEVDHMLDSVEQKISTLNHDLEANKFFFDQKLAKMKDAAILSEHLATIGQLAAGIAHEIRNPLTTVKGFIQLIQPYLVDIGKEEYALIALEEIDRANEIIYEFLNSAKPKENKKQIIDLQKLIKDIMMLFESEAILRNIDMESISQGGSVHLYLDTKQIKQVLVNLIKNAFEAIAENPSKEKGKIRIVTQSIEDFAVIKIEDNGLGMEKETVNNLFVPFYSTKVEGTGIGLTVCKKIIEEHGGNISVSSTPYLGTSFRIELPIYRTS